MEYLDKIKTEMYEVKNELYQFGTEMNQYFYDAFKKYFTTKLEKGYESLVDDYKSSVEGIGNILDYKPDKPKSNNGYQFEPSPELQGQIGQDIKRYETLFKFENKLKPKKTIKADLPLQQPGSNELFYPEEEPEEEEPTGTYGKEREPLSDTEKAKYLKKAKITFILLILFIILSVILYWNKPLWLAIFLEWIWP